MYKNKKTIYIFFISLLAVLSFSGFSFAQQGASAEVEIEEKQEEELLEVQCDLENSDNFSDEMLQQVLDTCEAEIEQQKGVLEEKQKETASISRDVSILNYQINQSEAFIKAKALQIRKIQKQIEGQKIKVVELEDKASKARIYLSDLIKEKNKLDNFSFLEAVLSKKTISEFFADINDLNILEKEIGELFGELEETKNEVEKNKNQLEEEESVEKQLSQKRQDEIKTIEVNKKAKEYLLSIKKDQEKAYQKVIEDKEKIRNEIRNKMFKTVGGTKISFGDALNLIKPYESQLGVEPAFILAILFQETGVAGKIGGNIGECYYNQIHPVTGRTVMSLQQVPDFLKIMNGLGIDPATQKVSCPIPRDGAYGGAMGPAQFMPATWMDPWTGPRKRAAEILGKTQDSLSPFNNRDSFIASAIYLEKIAYSSSCNTYVNDYKHIADVRTLRERCAAARYYAGSNWWKFRFSYGDPVLKKADLFRYNIKTLGL